MWRFGLILGLLGSLAACGGPPERDIETRILCVWDSWDGDLSTAPTLAAWNKQGHVVLRPRSQTLSMSASLACLLTGSSVREHGLHSVHELGAETVDPGQATRAEALPKNTRSLASVSRAHFAFLGLSRGVDEWIAPEFSEGTTARPSAEVWSAVTAPLDAALASDAPLFLVLHFSDLRADRWRNAIPSDELLEAGLADWRGKGGEIDRAFADEDSDFTLVDRLSKILLRRKDDPRRAALEKTMRQALVLELDGVLGALREMLQSHGRLGAARLELDSGADPDSVFPAGQSLLALGSGELEEVQSKLIVGQETLAPAAPGEFQLPRRGMELLLTFKHPQLLSLNPEDIGIGQSTLAASDVPNLLPTRSAPWPENSIVGPVLDWQKAGGRKLVGELRVDPGTTVELLLEEFPRGEGWPQDIEVSAGSIEPHPRRTGAIWIRGQGPISITLPPRASGSRLGIVLRVNGARLSGSRVRYLQRLFSAPDSLTLGFSAGTWLQEELRGSNSADSTSPLRVELGDEWPLITPSPLSSAEQAYLRRLNSND